MSDILDRMQRAPSCLRISFSILTRFGSLETLLYGPTEGALSLEYTSFPPRNEHPRELYRGYT